MSEAQSAPSEGIGTLEIGHTRKCEGLYLDTQTGRERQSRFNYTEYRSSAIRVLANSNFSEEEHQSLLETYTSLGIKDVTFSVFSRGEKGEGDPDNKHLYLLLHGWTANKDIYSEVPMSGGLSVVEQIMAMDPDAVIVAMDGNGFGGTNFQKTVSESENFGNYCTAEAYARQADFLAKDVLRLDPKQVTVVGHSMGGAATYHLMGMGYKGGVAIAPAAFPSPDSIGDAQKVLLEADPDKMADVLSKYGLTGVNMSALVYKTIEGSVRFGQKVKDIGGGLTEGFVDKTVEKIFGTLTPLLMGHKIEGVSKSDRAIIKKLLAIHAGEVIPEKYSVVREAIGALARGVDYRKLSAATVEGFAKVATFSGTEDLLVQPQDLEANCLMFLAKAMDTPYEKAVAQAVGDALQEDHKIDGGHYAGVYSPKVIAAAVSMAKGIYEMDVE